MIKGLNHITLAVRDLEKSFDFYTRVLNFKPLAKWKLGAYLLCGEHWFCLSYDENAPRQVSEEYTHISLTAEPSEFAAFSKTLERNKIKTWKENNSEGESIYFLDPDNHKLEIHVGSWQSRIATCKQDPYEDMKFFV